MTEHIINVNPIHEQNIYTNIEDNIDTNYVYHQKCNIMNCIATTFCFLLCIFGLFFLFGGYQVLAIYSGDDST